MSLLRDQSAALSQPIGGAGEFQHHLGAQPLGAGGDRPVLRLDVRRSLQLHSKLALSIAVVGLVGAIAYLLLVQRLYKAQSIVNIQQAPSRIIDNGANTQIADANSYETLMREQMAAVTRSDVLADAAKRINKAMNLPVVSAG